MSHLEVDTNPDIPEPPTPQPEEKEVDVILSIREKKFISYRKNCKICNHPRRAEIEKRLIHGNTYAEIIEKEDKELGIEPFPDLNPANLSAHFRNHMPRPMKEVLEEQYKEHAEKQIDAIKQIQAHVAMLGARLPFLLNPSNFRSHKDQIQALEIARRIIDTTADILIKVRKLEGSPQTVRGFSELLDRVESEIKKRDDQVAALVEEKKKKKLEVVATS